MRGIVIAALALVAAGAAMAQDIFSPTTSNALSCITTFRDLDRNANGVLEDWEVGPNNPRVPTAVSTSWPIAEADFVRVCSGGRTLPQGGSPEN